MHTRLITVLFAFWLMGCSGQKENEMKLENWLEQNAPGKYVIINNIIDLDPKNLFYKKKQTVIGLKEDPEVQIKITWYKNEDENGLDLSKIDEDIEAARQDMIVARKISSQLKDHGLEKMAVGVMMPAIYFLPYGEPSPGEREKILSGILDLFKKQDFPSYTSIWIEFMEDSVYQQEIKEVIPNGYWYRGDGYHEDHKIMSHNFEWNADLTTEILKDGWEFNASSNRAGVYQKESFPHASAWADKHLKKPFYLEPNNLVQYQVDDENPLIVHYSFPYFEKQARSEEINADPLVLGYVTGKFHTDLKTFTEIGEREQE